MKKYLFMLLLIPKLIFGEEISTEAFLFTEGAQLFQIIPYLHSAESGENVNPEELEYLFTQIQDARDVGGLLIRSFFRETENENIQSLVKEWVKRYSLSSPYIEAVLNRYKLQKREVDFNDQDYLFDNAEQDYQDENLHFSSLDEFSLFDSSLIIYLPHSDWNMMHFEDSVSGEIDSETAMLMSGGGTTALSVNIKRLSNSSAGTVSEHTPGDPENPTVVDKNLFSFTDINVQYQNGLCTIAAYFVTHEGITYQINYYYNMSHSNVNYDIFDQLAQQLVHIAYLTYYNG